MKTPRGNLTFPIKPSRCELLWIKTQNTPIQFLADVGLEKSMFKEWEMLCGLWILKSRVKLMCYNVLKGKMGKICYDIVCVLNNNNNNNFNDTQKEK